MIRDAHAVVSWVFILANGAVGLWALAAHQWPKCRHRAGWIAVVIAETRTAATAGSPASFMDQIHTALDLENGRRTGEDVDDLTMVCLSVNAASTPIRRAA